MTYRSEVQEAIIAGRKALNALQEAKELLRKAKGWGMADMFGMDLLGGLMKHSKMNDAKSALEKAKYELNCFDHELEDVSRRLAINLDTNDLLGFADFLFDGLFVDLMMQSRISNAMNQIDKAINQVESILNDLERNY